MKILIVDDEIKIREVVSEYAKASGYECDQASNGKDAIDMVAANNYDCVILDIMMPELDGFSACKKIKAIKNVPVIMLSARTEEDDKLFSFDLGVDDYVTKPFSPKELMARIRVVCERNAPKSADKYVIDTLVIDVLGRSVTIDNKKVTLTPKELDLLIYMVENKNIALGRDKLLSAVWEMDYYDDDRTIDTHIKMLRKDLGPYADHIVTVRGMGYKFEV
ncbi:MAG: response regulator transcription factor [Erysipelotrichaceae bacterium]|jgi:DNA-binding response OmpR family regulator|nr:response regulator transcription factor [Erysipelotrichaceae bacterium]MBP1529484.1 response regulator transcription factor [Erysipelotrichaceae bacterium]MBQ1288439.1 response regulator transcription factor [Erysipelotrichaceae bacterium]MBQ1323395.1 response regulator transcription factor [Erysipelotrichaceae bacterium]MBQ1346732.1 response regulator transcription factor [Erysipelotrichaceae bacterium]